MADLLESYRIRLTPLTPVHVGSGEVLEPYQYVLHGNEVWVLNLTKLIEVLPEQATESYLAAIERGPFEARKRLREFSERFDLEPAVSWKAPAASGFKEFLTKALDRGTGELGIRLFPSSLPGTYLPGSSLKGALRTALLFDASRQILKADLDDKGFEWRGEYDLVWEQKGGRLDEGRWRRQNGRGRIRAPYSLRKPRRNKYGAVLRVNQSFEAFTLDMSVNNRGKPEITTDPLRALGVSDSDPLPSTEFHIVEVFGSKKNPSGRTGIAQLAQVWTKGATEATLRIHTGLLKRSEGSLRKSGRVLQDGLYGLAASAYDRLAGLAEDERQLYANRGWEKAVDSMDMVLESIDNCLADDGSLRKPFRFPLRIGYGSGELSVRLAEFIEYTSGHRNERINPISRKLSEGLPMGWIMVEVIE